MARGLLGPDGMPFTLVARLRGERVVRGHLDGVDALAAIGFDPGGPLEPPGYVPTRMTDDDSGRPIVIVLTSTPPEADGSPVFLAPTRPKDSVNHRHVVAGFAYPRCDNTLFADLRRQFDVGLAEAQTARRGHWPLDESRTRVRVRTSDDLTTIDPIWPKLWRRLQRHLSTHVRLMRAFGSTAAQLAPLG